MTAESSPFSRQIVGWLIGLGFLAFFGALLTMLFQDTAVERTNGANPFSRSAIGHEAFVETLDRLGTPVLVSRSSSALRARGGVLVVPEPGPDADEALLDELLSAERVLVILPKWTGVRDPDRPRWIGRAELLPEEVAGVVLARVAGAGAVTRPDAPGVPTARGIGDAPALARPQLMHSDALRPLVAYEEGILLGEVRGTGNRIWVLSDPDAVNNHGLGKADNAAFAVGFVEALRPAGGTVVFDTTILGFERHPSLWRALFEFPFVVATIMALAAVGALMWSAAGRFGPARRPEAPFEAGKARLIGNTAQLVGYGGHAPELLARYFRASVRDVARRVHAPRHLDEDGVLAWLDRVADARGVGWRATELHAQAAAAGRGGPNDPRIARTAYAIFRWKREMIDGSGRHTEAR